jgi:hypothetical protein
VLGETHSAEMRRLLLMLGVAARGYAFEKECSGSEGEIEGDGVDGADFGDRARQTLTVPSAGGSSSGSSHDGVDHTT